MAKRMLIDASHAEETRVVILSGNRLDEFDYETSNKVQNKGNIYLAKVTRVEPSLQAAFVDYGGNRHGFLAFNEIHPDYFRIPVADREALFGTEAKSAPANAVAGEPAEPVAGMASKSSETDDEVEDEAPADGDDAAEDAAEDAIEATAEADSEADETDGAEPEAEAAAPDDDSDDDEEESVETVGGGDDDDIEQQRMRQRILRNYKIQEVIKRGQIMLVQVTKEERGNKGAALTTYLSLAGRYCVLMPNTARGGGVSRKISNGADRKRLRVIMDDMEIPDGMAVIVRTAGAQRSKAEIRRDYEYLLRLWDQIRQTTLESVSPALIHEEGNLIKRTIRDLYSRDIDEVIIEGDEGYKSAKQFMRMMMPSHAKRVQPYKDEGVSLFQRYQVESQLDEIHSNTVRLKSGGYLVITPTEALVSVDVNSGRSTRERHIEETALKTNLEAAQEMARQLRLRDLAGLIVIDFIDMDEHRNNIAVERKLKEALRGDRARIQIGRISPFGLLEMSRQRLRPSLLETSSRACPHCGGTGHIRSVESSALQALRGIEEEGQRGRTDALVIMVPTEVALYLLNQKRPAVADIEARYGITVQVGIDPDLVAPDYRIERPRSQQDERQGGRQRRSESRGADSRGGDSRSQDNRSTEEVGEEDGDRQSKRGRSRRRKRRRDDQPANAASEERQETSAETQDDEAPPARASSDEKDGETANGDGGQRRRRGRRGGRRRRRQDDDSTVTAGATAATVDGEAQDEAAEQVAADSASDAAAPAEEAATGDAEPAETVAEAAADADAAPEKAERPKRRTRQSSGRRRRSTAADTAEAAAETSPETTETPETGETEAPAAADAEAAKPKRTRRRRTKASETEKAETAAAPAETPPAEDAPREEQDAPGQANGSGGNGAVASEAEPQVDEAGDDNASGDDAPPPPARPRSRRKGWWQRLIDG